MASQSGHCGNSPDTPADDASSEDGGTDWPTKSINMIVPMGAGGDTDFNARTYAKYLEDVLGETVVVTNITGNGGALGSEEVKNASPDGYTCLFYHTCLNINQATGIADYGSEAFETVAVVGKSSGEAVVVRADAPYDTMEELIAYSQANPQTVKIAANWSHLSLGIRRTECGGRCAAEYRQCLILCRTCCESSGRPVGCYYQSHRNRTGLCDLR